MESKLFEQIYRTNRIYYHGSPYNFNQFEIKSRYHTQLSNSVFLTSRRKFAYQFALYAVNDKPDENTTLYTCKLNTQVNLFNPSSKSDLEKFENIATDEQLEKVYYLFNNNKPIRDWNVWEKSDITEVIKNLLYDGFCVSENGIENISLFNPASTIKILKKESVLELKNKFGDKLGYTDITFSYNLSGNIKTYEEIQDIIKDTFEIKDSSFDIARRISNGYKNKDDTKINEALNLINYTLLNRKYNEDTAKKMINRFLSIIGLK